MHENPLSPTVQERTPAYGLDAAFYALWLDRYMAYSCANWDDAADLHGAQLAKLDAALDALTLPRGGHFLDVGCGWGSLLKRGAERGYHGHGLAPVAEHASYCRQQGYDVSELPWQAVRDSRVYDGVASIGAFEHVAARTATAKQRAEQYGQFFAWSAQRLHEGGRMYLQTMCFLVENIVDFSPCSRHTLLRVLRSLRPVRRQWPHSMLPLSLLEIITAADPYFEVIWVKARRRDYARTCAVWRERLSLRHYEAVRLAGEKTVKRVEDYLGAARSAFEQGMMNLYQIVFSKRQTIPELA